MGVVEGWTDRAHRITALLLERCLDVRQQLLVAAEAVGQDGPALRLEILAHVRVGTFDALHVEKHDAPGNFAHLVLPARRQEHIRWPGLRAAEPSSGL